MIGARGYLRQEPQEDDSKKNGNGNGNGHSKSNGSGRNGGGNGNGNSGGNGGNGGMSEATMTSSQKRKDTMLKKKYDDSDMKKNMKKQYGKEEGEKVYYATIRKQAMESKLDLEEARKRITFKRLHHGTDVDSAKSIMKDGPKPSSKGSEGPGHYVTGDRKKARKYAEFTSKQRGKKPAVVSYLVPKKSVSTTDNIPKGVTDKKKTTKDKPVIQNTKTGHVAMDSNYAKKHRSNQQGRIFVKRKKTMESNLGKLDEVDYYSGQDRNPATGLPRGIRSIPGGKKDKPLKNVPYNILRAHTEMPVTDIKVSSMDELTDYKTFIQQSLDARKRKIERAANKQKADKEYMKDKAERVKKGIRFYDKKGTGYIKKGVKTYEENQIHEADFNLSDLIGGSNKEYDLTNARERMIYNRLKKAGKNPLIKKVTETLNTEGSLHKWFKGSKSKDGKGGWVNVVTGGTCASDEPGEGTPKCVSSSKRASMSKAERLSAARRKKKADPGQQSKSGAAKPTYVSTDKPKKKMKEENQITEADKKGKGSGTKDACYHKVKSRYSVWPSAYASGALVKCRKVGAANWGNSKKEEFEGNISYSTFMEKCWKGYEKKGMKTMFGKRYPNCVKKEETQLEDSRLTSSNDMQSKMYADKNKSGKKMSDDEIKKEKGGKEFLARLKAAKEKMKKEETEVEKIRRMIKTKMMNGKPLTADQIEGLKAGLTQGGNTVGEGTAYGMYKGDGKPKGPMAKFGEKKKSKKIEEKVNLKDKSSQYARSTKEVDTAMTDHVNRTRGKNYNLKTGKVTDVGRYRRPSKREARNELISLNKESKSYAQFQQECWKTHKKVGMKMKGGKLVPDCRPKNEEVEVDEAAAWTRKAGKNKSGGLNEKGRKSYERENPGSDLKAPSKKVGNPRRASFCARMKGMKKKLTSSKTANDPDSRINKSLRKWNC